MRRVRRLFEDKLIIVSIVLLDMNECTEIEGYCSNGTCTNTIGGSKCECTTGFTISPSGDRCIGELKNSKRIKAPSH